MDLILAEPIDVKSQERQVEFLGYQTRTRCAREHWPWLCGHWTLDIGLSIRVYMFSYSNTITNGNKYAFVYDAVCRDDMQRNLPGGSHGPASSHILVVAEERSYISYSRHDNHKLGQPRNPLPPFCLIRGALGTRIKKALFRFSHYQQWSGCSSSLFVLLALTFASEWRATTALHCYGIIY